MAEALSSAGWGFRGHRGRLTRFEPGIAARDATQRAGVPDVCQSFAAAESG